MKSYTMNSLSGLSILDCPFGFLWRLLVKNCITIGDMHGEGIYAFELLVFSRVISGSLGVWWFFPYFYFGLLKGEVWTHKTNLTPRLFIEVPTCQDRKVGGHIYVYYGYQFWLSVIFRFEFGTVLTWYSVFHFHIYVSIDVMFSLRIVMLCNIPFT